MEIKTQKPLEERARDLLRWKLTGEGRRLNPFSEAGRLIEELQFLISCGYVVKTGGTPKSLKYCVTSKGLEYTKETP